MKTKFSKDTIVPRWVIQLIDLGITGSSFAFSFFFTREFEFFEIYRGHFFVFTGLYCCISFLSFLALRIHTGLIRYSNIVDIVRIFGALLLSSILYLITIKYIFPSFFSFALPDVNNILIVNFLVSFFLLTILRAVVKQVFLFARRSMPVKQEKIVVYGMNYNALLIKNALEAETNNSFKIVGFVEKSNKRNNTYIEQKRVFKLADLYLLKKKYNVDKLVLSDEQLSGTEKDLLVDQCLKHGIKLMTVPPANQWVHGKLSLNQLKDLNIEDLLQREPININNSSILNEISGKRILVTGAAGSIGGELVRQVLKYNPEIVILCDQAESALHEMELETEEAFPNIQKVFFIGDIRNRKRMKLLFDKFRPDIIFHAAAYKHVPMMERNPCEAILANVLGTKNISEMALLYGASKFIMVSTDKAVNPTNIMGASKRIAEIYIQSLNDAGETFFELQDDPLQKKIKEKEASTKFITTRFGNVLGSNGSVLPRFRAQIQRGGPVTVTDPEITRYFMTIPEAVQLVLEAATMGEGGEIFVFDMGKPVKILNLALQMILLAGLEPNKDIAIQFTGLRPGEKLYEELLNDKELTTPTHHEKIKIAKVIANNYEQVLYSIEQLLLLCNHNDDELVVQKMKELLPEFFSKNSVFEHLDRQRSLNHYNS